MGVESEAIIGSAEENILYIDLMTTHEVDAVRPAPGRESLEIPDGDIAARSSEHRIVARIENCDAVDENILGVGHFYAAQGMVENAASDDAHVLGMVHDKTCLDDASRCKIYGTVGGNPDVLARKILGAVEARGKVDEPGILHEDILLASSSIPVDAVFFLARICLLQHRIGKDVEIVVTVTTKLYADVFRLLQSEMQECAFLADGEIDGCRGRPHHGGQRVGSKCRGFLKFHAQFHASLHIKLCEGRHRPMVHVHLAVPYRHRLPFSACRTSHAHAVCSVGLESAGGGIGIDGERGMFCTIGRAEMGKCRKKQAKQMKGK